MHKQNKTKKGAYYYPENTILYLKKECQLEMVSLEMQKSEARDAAAH